MSTEPSCPNKTQRGCQYKAVVLLVRKVLNMVHARPEPTTKFRLHNAVT
jgi:hypothetical protein